MMRRDAATARQVDFQAVDGVLPQDIAARSHRT